MNSNLGARARAAFDAMGTSGNGQSRLAAHQGVRHGYVPIEEHLLFLVTELGELTHYVRRAGRPGRDLAAALISNMIFTLCHVATLCRLDFDTILKDTFDVPPPEDKETP